MKKEILFKPDWEKAKERWEAYWERVPMDRPIICVKAKLCSDENIELPEIKSIEDIYFCPEYVAKKYLKEVKNTWFGGESVPTGGFLMGGYALGCDENVKFDDRTVWHPHMIDSMEKPIKWPLPNSPWRKKLEKVVKKLLEVASGKFLVGYVMQVPVNDLLYLLRGPQEFLIEIAENIEICCKRLEEVFPLWVNEFNYFRNLIDSIQGNECVYGWPGLWHPNFFMATQSDMSCLISTEMFEKYVMKEMDLLGEMFGCVWYHLDGPGALRHLPILLSRPYIHTIQYVPGAGQPPNGPFWIEIYKQIQKAGKSIDIDCSLGNIEYLIKHLKPEGVILRTEVKTIEEGEELLYKAKKWAGSEYKKQV